MTENALEIVKHAMDEKLAQDIRVLDFRSNSPFVDYFVICTARNEANAGAILDEIEEKLYEAGYTVDHIDRTAGSGWFLLEAGGVLAHVFWGGSREYYGLEELWKDLLI